MDFGIRRKKRFPNRGGNYFYSEQSPKRCSMIKPNGLKDIRSNLGNYIPKPIQKINLSKPRMIKILFENDKEVRIEESATDKSLLQISLDSGIPHTHACGGNARCSTCRVLVQEGAEHLLPRNEKETLLAHRKGFPENVRLACQTKINGDVKVRRLVIDDADQILASTFSDLVSGTEKPVTVLFSDIRGFTGFSETHLPYDVIHILNRYFYRMGDKVLKYGGTIDKYIGDGLMAVFGLTDSTPLDMNLSAVRCALEMGSELEQLNIYLKNHLGSEFQIGIGINYGTAILGKLGHPLSMSFTAIGDTVNSASRIESTTKKAATRLLVSEKVYEIVKDWIIKGRTFETKLKGKTGTYKVYEILSVKPSPKENSWEETKYRIWDSIDPTEAGAWIRMVFHASAIFSAEEEWLGIEGSIRFPTILNQEDNKGVKKQVETLVRIREEMEKEGRWEVPSLSDMIAVSGSLALQKAGGPSIPILPGRKDSEYPAGRMLMPTDSPDAKDSLRYFSKMGLSVRDTVLLLGVHTLGWHSKGSFTDTPNLFNNHYFRDLLLDGGIRMLATDRALLGLEETKRMVMEYALDEPRFYSDFTDLYRRLVEQKRLEES
ncbi:adenylate/guanylate cyclase catalytic domain protein [Leptospira wolffii serovar Khorat str. Khorat-H2]|nr:adenylate/guanylate cyclase catalytic domain protein [Leptospira wolffii serovar Khorat str. Khorat-H2]